MDSVTLLAQAQAAGLTVYAEGDRLVVQGPRSAEPLAQTLLAHKAELMPLLTTSQTPASRQAAPPPPSDVTGGDPCPVCAASAWRDTPDAGRWCVPCVVAGRDPVAAVKVRSDALDAEIWVVADDLPREEWPAEAPIYRQSEVKILAQVSQDALVLVHATKTMFDAQVVDGGGDVRPLRLIRLERRLTMDKVIAELSKGPLDKLVISLREYQGHPFIDIRLHFLADDDVWRPTKKGVTISPSQWDEFMTALGRVQAHLPPEGSAPARRRAPQGGSKR